MPDSVVIPYFPGGATVLMAVYSGDDPDLFKLAVDSVYSNTLLPDAFILVVDGPVSTHMNDIIEYIVAQYGVNAIRLAVNSGLAHALNVGIGFVDTEWILRADSDDINYPDRFASQAQALSDFSFGLDVIGGSIREISSAGILHGFRRLPSNHLDIFKFARSRNPINHMTVAFRRSRALEVGGYPDLYLKEDYGLWIRLLASGSVFHNISKVLVDASAGPDMYRRRSGLKYVRSEFMLQKFLVSKFAKSIIMASAHFVLRSTVFLFPNFLRGFVYEKLLRSRS